MTVYNTGTVSVTNGNAVVTGSGTAWQIALVTGGMFSRLGLSVPILSVDSDTQITLAYVWPGATASGAAYAIARESSAAASIVDVNDRLARILAKLALSAVHPDGVGSLADRDALDPAPADGFIFLRMETGEDLELYRKVPSGWDGPFVLN